MTQQISTQEQDAHIPLVLTPKVLSTIYSKLTGLEPSSPLKYVSHTIYRGFLSRVTAVEITPEGSSDKPVPFIVKHYVPPDEQTLTHGGVATKERVDSKEFLHLLRFNHINPVQPRPLYHDTENHAIALERLDGDYHSRLGAQYQRFMRASQRDRERITAQVVADLEDILTMSLELSATITTSFDPSHYAVSTMDKDLLWARHHRSVASVVAIGKTLDIGTLLCNSSRPRDGTNPSTLLTKITPAALARDTSQWTSRYVVPMERSRIFSYALSSEAVAHGDMLPGNILYRQREGEKRLQFALCDLGKIFHLPFDVDMISLLMVDPRIKLMVPFDERKGIYDHFFASFSQHFLSKGKRDTAHFTRDERFTIGSVMSLMRYMGAVYFSLDHGDPIKALQAGGNLELLAEDPHLPFQDKTKYFGIQYASLLEVLRTSSGQKLFPRLGAGISSFFKDDSRSDLESLLHHDPPTAYKRIGTLFTAARRFFERTSRRLNFSSALF